MAMRPAKKPMKAPFVVTVSVAAVAAVASLVAGCGGRVPSAPEELISANPPIPPGPGPKTTCTSDTRAGDACAEGEGACAPSPAISFVCTNGLWGSPLIGNPPLPPYDPCPETEPTEGASCSPGQDDNAHGLCGYLDHCPSRPASIPDARVYVCSTNQWVRTTNSYRAKCPTAPPTHDSPCGPCLVDLPAQCNYDNGTGCPPVVAVCDKKAGTWNVAISSCNPPPPPVDAGSPDP